MSKFKADKIIESGKVVVNAPSEFPHNVLSQMSYNQAVKNSNNGKNVIWTSEIDVELPIRVGTGRYDGLRPRTVIEMFHDRLRKHPNAIALSVKRNGKWIRWTWRQYYNDCCTYAKALMVSGVKSRSATCIMGFNSPEWVIANFGTIFADCVAAGIYTTNTPDAVKYIADHTEASIVAVDTAEQSRKFIACKKSDPSFRVRTIVQWLEPVTPDLAAEGVVSWSDFMKMGATANLEADLNNRMTKQTPGSACELVYTSGTTGHPKGVLLSHDNLTYLGDNLSLQMEYSPEDRIVSYLPLSHIAAQAADLLIAISSGAACFFAQPDALKGSIIETLKEVRPTIFFAVPRVWEKFEEKIRAIGAESTGVKKKISEWAKATELAAIKAALLEGKELPLSFKVSDTLMNLVRKNLGLDQTKICISGAAPLPRATQEYFMSLGIPICDLFGMSECTGPETFNAPFFGSYKMGSIGRPLPGTDVEILNPDEKGVGEVTWRGRNVFMGYYKNEKATQETFDNRGFMKSGDLGRVDKDGFVYITGRAKELLITAGGENVAPTPLENALKEELPEVISNCQVVGDQKKFLGVLVTLKSTHTADSQPTRHLDEGLKRLLESKGSTVKTTTEAMNCPVLHKIIVDGLHRANKKAPSKAQNIQRYRILEDDYSMAGGEIGPTMKTKRNFAIVKHEKVIDDLYSHEHDLTMHPGGLKTPAHQAKM
eukprot:GDKJ01016081.1.p1 GENE.GDKJ01016081.1~~GDKJ01016081.1.p1  ORF type:complete len:711 (-),score=167.47 GDKJ01016081.1:1258-3390(-)